jgi:hypothetical protein
VAAETGRTQADTKCAGSGGGVWRPLFWEVKMAERTGKTNKQIIDEVSRDYEKRKEMRKILERTWQLNLDFYKGKQNLFLTELGGIVKLEKQYFWQMREVFNHIGPLVENRLAILSEVKPPITDEVVRAVLNRMNFDKLVEQGNFWQEVCGTVFYKVVSNNDGNIKIAVCSPFEIYPDKLNVSDMAEIGSIIHSKIVDGELVIERWSADRLTIIRDGKLEYDGVLPGPFPFIRGTSEIMAGEFFGKSVVERAIPVQRAYNAVKNRRAEFMNRMACGVVSVEEGSVDIDSLEIDGLCPGKIIVYRQGAKEPKFMDSGDIPSALQEEEQRLLAEFATITGGGDFISELTARANIGATSLQLINEQSKVRMRRPIQSINDIYAETERKIKKILKI